MLALFRKQITEEAKSKKFVHCSSDLSGGKNNSVGGSAPHVRAEVPLE